jgi:thioredoxin-dependent peroxiredoxin
MIFNLNAKAESLEIGSELPKVTATLDSGDSIDLSPLANQKYVLVYFYPKADTPGCTKQACSLRDSYEVLTEKGVTVLGVSKDSVKSQSAFKEKYDLPFSLIADRDSAVIKAFGVSQKLGFASRQAYLFKEGKLVWKDLAASTSKQAEDVLKFIEEDSK